MKEGSDDRLPKEIIQQFKDQGFIERATSTTEAVMRCATCPLAEGEPFYGYRAQKCADLPPGPAASITTRLATNGFLENRRVDQSGPINVPPRVLYDANKQAKETLKGIDPLNGCQKREV